MDFGRLAEMVDEKIRDRLGDMNEHIEKCVALRLADKPNVLYEIDHSWDPAWDHSGETKAVGEINLESTSFQEYLEMYTGQKHASYCSGCGFFHNTYRDWIEDKVQGCLGSVQENVVLAELQELNIQALFEVVCEYSPLMKELGLSALERRFNRYLDEAKWYVCDKLNGKTLAFEIYEVMDMLPVFQENPLLSEIFERNQCKVDRILDNRRIVSEYMEWFVAAMRNKMPDSKEFFKDRKLTKTKEDEGRRQELSRIFTKEVIALIAYFEPWHFSGSLVRDCADGLCDMVRQERKRIEGEYPVKIVFA